MPRPGSSGLARADGQPTASASRPACPSGSTAENAGGRSERRVALRQLAPVHATSERPKHPVQYRTGLSPGPPRVSSRRAGRSTGSTTDYSSSFRSQRPRIGCCGGPQSNSSVPPIAPRKLMRLLVAFGPKQARTVHFELVPPRTWKRHRKRLSLEESSRTERLVRVLAHAEYFFDDPRPTVTAIGGAELRFP